MKYMKPEKFIRLTLTFLSLLTLLLIISGCSSSVYMVSVIERSPEMEPLWITHLQENEMVGFGENRNKKLAYDEAIIDLQKRIASEIGVEFSVLTNNTILESSEGYLEKTESNVNIITDAIIREVHSKISGTYWEHCREKTGRKNIKDFYRFYVKANISSDLIKELRELTIEENNYRLSLVDKYLEQINIQVDRDSTVHPIDNLRNYISALNIANTLFYNREHNSRICVNGIEEIINNLELIQVTGYSEVRPEIHYYEFQTLYKGAPAYGIKIKFNLVEGIGNYTQSAVTDQNGMVRSDIYSIAMNRDNLFETRMDFSDLLFQLREINSPMVPNLITNISNSMKCKILKDSFSTMAQVAHVRAGVLELDNVRKYRSGFFNRVRNLDCNFVLEEVNGRSASFHQYNVEVKCTYKRFLGTKHHVDIRNAKYNISEPLEINYNQMDDYTFTNCRNLASLINDLKSEHDMGIKRIQISIRLIGKDDAGNDLTVDMQTENMKWKNIFNR